MTVVNGQQPNSAEVVDLGMVFRTLLSGWKIIIVCVLLTLLSALIYLRETVNVYSVDALVQVDANQDASDALLNSLSGAAGGLSSLAGLADKSPADTEIQLLQSRFVLGEVIHNLNLDIVLSSDQDRWYRRIFYPSSRSVVYGEDRVKYSDDTLSFDVVKFDVPFALLDQTFKLTFVDGGGYTLELVDGSKISGFESQGVITGVVGRVLNQPLVDGNMLQLLIQKSNKKLGTVYLGKKSLVKSVKDINDSLTIAEKGKQTGVIGLTFEGGQELAPQILNEITRVYLQKNIASRIEQTESTLDFLARQLPRSKDDLEAAEDRYNKFREKNSTIDPTQEAQLLLQQIIDLKTKRIDLQQQSVLMSQKYTAHFPLVAQVNAQISSIDQNLKDLDARVTAMPDLQRQYLQVYRDVQVDTMLYTSLLNSYQQLKVVKAGKVATVRILDQAVKSGKPIKPQKALILLMSIVLGVIVGGLVVFLKSTFLSGVKDSVEIEAKTGLSVLATVPYSRSQQKMYVRNAKKRGLLAKIDPEDLAIESLRSLRTVMHFSSSKASNNVILITGPSPEIGKSFISVNFAAVCAQMGKKVILVDADMRRGTLKNYFGLNGIDGLSDYLKDSNLSLDYICQHTSIEGLDFISKGSTPANPAELLLSERFKVLIETLSAKYDYVLIDSPPILAATDAAIIAKMAGMTFVVARFAYTHIRELELSLARLSQAEASVQGILFNDVPINSGYDYQYAYQYRSHK